MVGVLHLLSFFLSRRVWRSRLHSFLKCSILALSIFPSFMNFTQGFLTFLLPDFVLNVFMQILWAFFGGFTGEYLLEKCETNAFSQGNQCLRTTFVRIPRRRHWFLSLRRSMKCSGHGTEHNRTCSNKKEGGLQFGHLGDKPEFCDDVGFVCQMRGKTAEAVEMFLVVKCPLTGILSELNRWVESAWMTLSKSNIYFPESSSCHSVRGNYGRLHNSTLQVIMVPCGLTSCCINLSSCFPHQAAWWLAIAAHDPRFECPSFQRKSSALEITRTPTFSALRQCRKVIMKIKWMSYLESTGLTPAQPGSPNYSDCGHPSSTTVSFSPVIELTLEGKILWKTITDEKYTMDSKTGSRICLYQYLHAMYLLK